jgi:hypothetical protein
MQWTNTLLAAAATGIVAGATGCNKDAARSDSQPQASASAMATGGSSVASSPAKHACKGQNACKGQGGCKDSEKHACKGENACKGQGGCKGA